VCGRDMSGEPHGIQMAVVRRAALQTSMRLLPRRKEKEAHARYSVECPKGNGGTARACRPLNFGDGG
jgi:hypothetical protein